MHGVGAEPVDESPPILFDDDDDDISSALANKDQQMALGGDARGGQGEH